MPFSCVCHFLTAYKVNAAVPAPFFRTVQGYSAEFLFLGLPWYGFILAAAWMIRYKVTHSTSVPLIVLLTIVPLIVLLDKEFQQVKFF